MEPILDAAPGDDFELEWRIFAPEAPAGDYEFVGPSLRIIFGLQANRYTARLTIHNKTNGMRYFHNFEIQGVTEFVRGTTVLSVEDRSEEHTSELQSLMRTSYAVFCLK